ncbi:MAG: V-type ATP synthase subunit K [Candidatus Paceibacterota bacterium]
MEITFGIGMVFAGAAIAAGLGFAGSALGMGYAGQAGAGVTSEKPDLFGRVLLLQALPGSQGIYGFVGAFLILNFAGLLGGGDEAIVMSTEKGLGFLMASIPLGIAAFSSGIFQGKVSASGIAMIAKDESLVAKAIVLSAMVETWAIFGLLISFIILTAI